MDAIAKLKTTLKQTVFMQAMRQLIISGNFLQISEEVVLLELLACMARSPHHTLIDILETLYDHELSIDVEEAVLDTIN